MIIYVCVLKKGSSSSIDHHYHYYFLGNSLVEDFLFSVEE